MRYLATGGLFSDPCSFTFSFLIGFQFSCLSFVGGTLQIRTSRLGGECFKSFFFLGRQLLCYRIQCTATDEVGLTFSLTDLLQRFGGGLKSRGMRARGGNVRAGRTDRSMKNWHGVRSGVPQFVLVLEPRLLGVRAQKPGVRLGDEGVFSDLDCFFSLLLQVAGCYAATGHHLIGHALHVKNKHQGLGGVQFFFYRVR